MRKLIGLLSAFIFLTSAALPTRAQDDAWPVEERCLGKPVQPAPDWTFDGTILMTGNSGIHGVNAAWETPRVLAFLDHRDLWGGSLSPDGMFYASPRGDFTITETYNGITAIDEVRIYSVDELRNHTGLPVSRQDYFFTGYENPQVYWRDDETIVYARTEFNLRTGQSADWPPPENASDRDREHRFYFAPDWTRLIFPSWRLADLAQNQVLHGLNITLPIAWKPDSSGFAATITDNADIPSYSLVLFDRDGDQLETIFDAPNGQQFGLFTVGWSKDSRYFAFIAFDYHPYQNKNNILYIADAQSKVIFNTCTATGEGLAWSPSTDEIAFLSPGEGLKEVFILDMGNYDFYRVAWHMVAIDHRIEPGPSGYYDGIIGWRES